jgi:hypothetical protein
MNLFQEGYSITKKPKPRKNWLRINKEQEELNALRKQVEELKTEKLMAAEKQKLLDEIAALQKEAAEKKIAEVVE